MHHASNNRFQHQLPNMESMDEEEILKLIREKVNQLRNYTPKIGVFGNSGVGKSSLCNALFGRDVAKINDVEACTRSPQEILIGDNNGEGGLILLDVPGIGEDPVRHKEYTELYKSLVPNLDLVLWAIKADDRNYASGLDAFGEIFKGENKPPVIFVVTQTDKTNDIEDWDHTAYQPGGEQVTNILRKEHDVSKRFNVSTHHIVSVAVSKKGKAYNLQELVSRVVDALPKEKKYSFTRETKEENVTEETRQNAEKGIFDTIKEFAGHALDKVADALIPILIEAAPKIAAKIGKWLKSWF